MGKENFLGESANRSSRRYNPYSTPVFLRPLAETRDLAYSRDSLRSQQSRNASNIDIDALAEYQHYLNSIKADSSTPLTSYCREINKPRPSPGYPIRELKMQRQRDMNSNVMDKLDSLRQIIHSMPSSVPHRSNLANSSSNNGAVSASTIPNYGGASRISTLCHNSFPNYSLRSDDPSRTLSASALRYNNFSGDSSRNGYGITSSSAFSATLMNGNLGSTSDRSNGLSSSSLFRNDQQSSVVGGYKSLFPFNTAPSPREPSPHSASNYASQSITPVDERSSASSFCNEKFTDKWRSVPDLSQYAKLIEDAKKIKRQASTTDGISHNSNTTSNANTALGDRTKQQRKLSKTSSTSSSELLSALERQRIFDQGERAYQDRKRQDDRDQLASQIKELEREVNARANARHNRQIINEEYRRMKLQLEGLVLEIQPKKEEFPELPEDAVKLIEKAWNRRGSPTEVFSTAFNVDITRKDLLSLSGLDWLNDEIINFYLNLIVERSRQSSDLPKVYAFNTFFYQSLSTKGYDSIKRWTRKVDIFSFDLLLVPVHMTVHWCMATVDLKHKCITYYDSMLGSNDRFLEIISNYLEQEHENKKKEKINLGGWKLVCRRDIPRQLNGSDCGMFACKFAEYASRRAEINFTQAEMPYFRKRMVYEICTQKLMS